MILQLKTLEGATTKVGVRSYPECEEIADQLNEPFLWDGSGEGTCYLISQGVCIKE